MGKASWAQDPDVLWDAIERETASSDRPRTLVRLTLDLWRHEPARRGTVCGALNRGARRALNPSARRGLKSVWD